MVRPAFFCLCAPLVVVFGATALAQPDLSGPPVTYEVKINGESFVVEGSRAVKLQSKEKPGTTYEIAIQVALTQRLRLNTVELEYDLPARLTDDRGRPHRTVQLKHELGFSMLITDLGEPLEASAQDEALKILTESVADSYKQQKGTDFEVGQSAECKFGDTPARRAKIHYKDDRDYGHTAWAFVLTGAKFSVTCVVQYLDDDEKTVLPLVKKTLDSIRAVP
jgi:hypothetical protein